MKSIKATIDATSPTIKIELFSDLHIGSKKCDGKLLMERINKVKDDPDTYAILVGDLINNTTRNSVGDVYEDALTPMDQIKKCVKLFEPIKDKILCVTAGNHERRSYKSDGIDLIYFFCAELGIADRYDYCAPLLFLRIKQYNNRYICYTIYATHGDGNGGRLVGGKANGLARRGQIVDADIIITGHTHQPLTFREVCKKIDYANSCVKDKEQVFINTSATLNYEEYAELYGMKPSSKQSPIIILDCTKKAILVTL